MKIAEENRKRDCEKKWLMKAIQGNSKGADDNRSFASFKMFWIYLQYVQKV